MAFAIDPKAPLDAEIRRLAVSQLTRIERTLGALRGVGAGAVGSNAANETGENEASAEAGLHAAVFETRKRLKKLRGLIRLVRGVAPSFYAEDNARYRDAGTRLSILRDRSAVVEALDRLVAHHAGRIEPTAFEAVRAALRANSSRATACLFAATGDQVAAAIDATLRDVGEARHRMDGFVIERSRKSPKILASGFAFAYGRAKRGLETIDRGSDSEAFHQLRKPMKYHWFHLRLLGPAWPAVLDPMAACAKAVVDDLGHDHDYQILRISVLAMLKGQGTTLPASEVSLLFALLDRRQHELRGSALAGAQRLLAIEPETQRHWMRRQLELAVATAGRESVPGDQSAEHEED